jgi:hypothetical protein
VVESPTRTVVLGSAVRARMARCSSSGCGFDYEDQVLIVGAWTYAGTGWRTTADAALALAAADAARSRRPAAVAA